MKEVNMETSWRTVQMFLDEEGVYEVEIDQDDPTKVRCTCPSFSKSSKCKHVKHVKEVMSANAGHYSINIPVDIDETEAFDAITDPDLFRNFVIKYAKVEVID